LVSQFMIIQTVKNKHKKESFAAIDDCNKFHSTSTIILSSLIYFRIDWEYNRSKESGESSEKAKVHYFSQISKNSSCFHQAFKCPSSFQVFKFKLNSQVLKNFSSFHQTFEFSSSFQFFIKLSSYHRAFKLSSSFQVFIELSSYHRAFKLPPSFWIFIEL
jgi:hypothetical protein